MGTVDFVIKENNSSEILQLEHQAAIKALKTMGMVAESSAMKFAPIDTGRLRASITHEVDGKEPAAYIGTNVEYAPYLEYGTVNMKAQPFLKPAVTENSEKFKQILKDCMENA